MRIRTSGVARRMLVVVAAFAILGTACGSPTGTSDDGFTPPGSTDEPAAAQTTEPVGDDTVAFSNGCELTTSETVAEVFGATVTSEEPGDLRECTYNLDGSPASSVTVYYYGTGAEWDAIREGYEENRGPLSDAAGLGQEAFHPEGDFGEMEVVVLAGDVAFAVGTFEPGAEAEVRALAERIAARLS